jgi:hypothetical protein
MSRITRKSLATRIKVGYLTRIALDHPGANQNNVALTPIKIPRIFSQELHTYGMAAHQTQRFDSPAFFVVC